MKLYHNFSELVGHTPLLLLERFCSMHRLSASIAVKLEFYNPAGSVKDRAAVYMIQDLMANGLLHEGDTIIEPTSGNTGIGLSAAAAQYGLRVILTMPDSMSVERRNLLKAHGAELVLTEGTFGMAGAIEKAYALQQEIPHSMIPGQFVNPANVRAHYETTGPEIWSDTDGNVAAFVAGVGTGGTLTGTARYLKEQNPHVQIVAVEPFGSQVLAGKAKGTHGLQGIGAGFIPEIMDCSVYDRLEPITEEEAYAACRQVAQLEGILIGISGGAALSAAVKLAGQSEMEGKLIVALMPDSGEHYLSMNLFSNPE